jgi:protein-S-isoprenylcysteine O-methyltransferase Ste14
VEKALRIILPLYLLAFFVVAFALRSYLVYRRTGVNPYIGGKGEGPIAFVQKLYAIPLVLIAVTTLAFAFLPGVYQLATPIEWLDSVVVQIVGLVLMGTAFLWTAIAQMQMGASWRIGIDTEHQTELVEQGLFRISRNPIFVGMRTALIGFFLALPNALNLTAVVLADVLIQVQVRLEEEFLIKVHGEKYVEFRKRVRRWI